MISESSMDYNGFTLVVKPYISLIEFRNLGVIMDKYLGFDGEVHVVTRIARYHILSIVLISKYLDDN